MRNIGGNNRYRRREANRPARRSRGPRRVAAHGQAVPDRCSPPRRHPHGYAPRFLAETTDDAGFMPAAPEKEISQLASATRPDAVLRIESTERRLAAHAPFERQVEPRFKRTQQVGRPLTPAQISGRRDGERFGNRFPLAPGIDGSGAVVAQPPSPFHGRLRQGLAVDPAPPVRIAGVAISGREGPQAVEDAKFFHPERLDQVADERSGDQVRPPFAGRRRRRGVRSRIGTCAARADGPAVQRP